MTTKTTTRFLAAGTKVVVAHPGPVPACSEWEFDQHRTSTPVKKRLQTLFFKGDRRIVAEVVFVPSESQRLALRSRNLTKVLLRDPAGSSIVITAPVDNLKPAGSA